MNLLELRSEVEQRGFDEVGSSRIDRWINRAYQRISDRNSWPFLVTSTTGTAPLTVDDLRAIYNVTDTAQGIGLEWSDIREIRERDPGYDATGDAQTWYLDGSTTVRVYPASGTTLEVHYVNFPAELTDDTDEPIFPERYHYLIVDAAVCEAYKDSDNLEAWQILRSDVEEQIREMENAILVPNFDGPAQIGAGFGSSVDW